MELCPCWKAIQIRLFFAVTANGLWTTLPWFAIIYCKYITSHVLVFSSFQNIGSITLTQWKVVLSVLTSPLNTKFHPIWLLVGYDFKFCNISFETQTYLECSFAWFNDRMMIWEVNECVPGRVSDILLYSEISLAKKCERGQTSCFHPRGPYDIAATHIDLHRNLIYRKKMKSDTNPLSPSAVIMIIIIIIMIN